MSEIGGVRIEVQEGTFGNDYTLMLFAGNQAVALSPKEAQKLVGALDSMLSIKRNPSSLEKYRVFATITPALLLELAPRQDGAWQLSMRLGDPLPEYGRVTGDSIPIILDRFRAALDTMATARRRRH